MRHSKAIIFLFVMAIAALLGIGFAVGNESKQTREITDENNDFISNLGTGYNLGNSLDVCDWDSKFESKYGNETETLWGGAVVTEKFVKKVAEDGFSTVRVPVTYMNHIDEYGNVDQSWLNRVGEVVDYVINNGMYCIVDIHHDTGNEGWIKATSNNYNSNKSIVTNMVKQIAEYFKEYDDYLILESFNEMVDDERHWDKAPSEALNVYNEWNQIFVDTVRATGGNNSRRYILINTYAATVDSKNIHSFKMPEDIVENRLIAGVHNYYDIDTFESKFSNIEYLKKCGYPVIIAEFGAVASVEFDRREYAEKFVNLCRNSGYCPIWWDNNESPIVSANSSFSLYNRKTNEVYYPEIVETLTGNK